MKITCQIHEMLLKTPEGKRQIQALSVRSCAASFISKAHMPRTLRKPEEKRECRAYLAMRHCITFPPVQGHLEK